MRSKDSASTFAMMLIANVMALLALAPTLAVAQHYRLRLPQPISGTEIEAYLVELNCSPDQQFTVLEFHRGYLEDHANWMATKQVPSELRLIALDEALNVADVIARFQRLRVRAKTFETMFFARIESILTAEQALHLPGVQQWRENQRLRQIASDAINHVPSAGVDLQFLRNEMPSWGGRNEFVVSWMSEYRIASTGILREIVRLSLEAPIEIEASMQYFDVLLDEVRSEQKQLNVIPGGDFRQQMEEIRRKRQILSDRWMRLHEDRRQVRDLFWRKVLLETCRLSVLNHRSFQALSGITNDEVYRRMLAGYHQRGFLNFPDSRGRAEEFFLALTNKSESDWEKDAKAISDLMVSYRDEIDGLFSQMRLHAIDVIKDQIVENTLPGSRTTKAHVKKMESYWSRYEAINTRTLQEFGEFASLRDSPRLRPMMEAGLRQRSDRTYQLTNVRFKTFDGKPSTSSTHLHSNEAGDSRDRRFQWPAMPTPIRLDSVLRIAMGLGLDRSMKSVVQLLHEDYEFRWKEATAPMSEVLREYREIYRLTLAGQHEGGKALSRHIDSRYGLYHELLKRYEELDGAFIDQFEAMLAKVHQPMFALWKQSRRVGLMRPALLDGTASAYTMTRLALRPHHELVILRVQSQRTDLFLLLLEEVESDDWINEETLSILSDHYRETTATYRAIHVESMACRRLLEEIYVEQINMVDEFRISEIDPSMWGKAQERICLESKRLLDHDCRTLKLIQSTLDEREAAAGELLNLYLARAFPQLVPDTGLENWLLQSLERPQLDEIRRTGIEELYYSYVDEYHRNSREIRSRALTTYMKFACGYATEVVSRENMKLSRGFLSAYRVSREKQKLLKENTTMRLRVLLGEDLVRETDSSPATRDR